MVIVDLLNALHTANGSAASSEEYRAGASSSEPSTPNGSTPGEAGPSDGTARQRKTASNTESSVEKNYTQDQLEGVRK